MYLLEFVNDVRGAQSCEELDRLPPAGADGSSPLELAMGCRLETGLMRLSSPQAAAAVSDATGLPVGVDRMTIALPQALAPVASELHVSRTRQAISRRSEPGRQAWAPYFSWGLAMPMKSSASSSTASSTPFSTATSRTVRCELAASLTISAARS